LKADISFEFFPNKEIQIKENPVISESHLTRFFEDLRQGPILSAYHGDPPAPDYVGNVREAIANIREGKFGKVVLSRYEDEQLPSGTDVFEVFSEACKKYPSAFVYLLYTPEHHVWLGATPEELLSIRENRFFKTVSLAGTQQLADDESLNEVAWTQKEIEEQAMVSRYVIDCFKKIRLREFVENGPKTIKAGMLASNSETHWVPEHLRDGRFGKWLEQARDWAISRNR